MSNPARTVALWDAINEYVEACGGDPSRHVYGNTRRMAAVVRVEAIVADAPPAAATASPLPLCDCDHNAEAHGVDSATLVRADGVPSGGSECDECSCSRYSPAIGGGTGRTVGEYWAPKPIAPGTPSPALSPDVAEVLEAVERGIPKGCHEVTIDTKSLYKLSAALREYQKRLAEEEAHSAKLDDLVGFIYGEGPGDREGLQAENASLKKRLAAAEVALSPGVSRLVEGLDREIALMTERKYPDFESLYVTLGTAKKLSAALRQAAAQQDSLQAAYGLVAEQLAFEQKRLGEAEALLKAQRVLWAWAQKHDEATTPTPVFHRYMSKVDGAPLPKWRIQIGTHLVAFAKPDEAVVALAQFLVREDPSLDATPEPQPIGAEILTRQQFVPHDADCPLVEQGFINQDGTRKE